MFVVTSATSSTRTGLALGISAVLHLALVLLLLFDQTLPYDLPTPPAPPIEMEIERIPEPITLPPPPIPPTQAQIPVPIVPVPPIPKPPMTTAVRPVAQTQAAPPAPPIARALSIPTFTPIPTPVITPAPTPSQTAAAAAAVVAPSPAIPRLNIHKPEKQAPAGVLTLPMAPAPAQRAGGGQPLGGEEPGLGSSRLKGLTPFTYGPMPSGGPGLRGSLVGCANAEAVALSSVERAHCNERFGVDAARAPGLDLIPREKRAAFDKSADRQNSWKAYRDTVPANGTPPGPNGMGRLGPLQPQGLIQDVMPHN